MDTFKEISIGGVGKEALLQRLIDQGVKFNRYAETLFVHPAFPPDQKIERVKLVKVGLPDLGLTAPCPYREILERAARRGLGVCPLSLGAFLRLEYPEQPVGPYLTIASAPLEEGADQPSGFYVRNFEGELWLRGYRATGDTEWPPENEFVFLEP